MACSSTPPLSLKTSTVVDQNITSTISTVHQDIIETHILTRLDGPTLASVACASSQLYVLASHEGLWTNICHSTWPSSDTPRLRHVISTFPNGPRSFFSCSYSLITNNSDLNAPVNLPSNHDRSSELISAIDVYYREKLIFSKVVETETVTGWFRCSPFRIDLLDLKDRVPTQIMQPETEETCQELAGDLSLSWIVIDPIGRLAVNLSSHRPVSVQRHWLSGEVHVRFASILAGDKRSSSEFVQCGIVVTCGAGGQGGEMHVREVSLQLEDMDGMHLNGSDSLVILQRALEGKRRNTGRREEEGKRRYEEYLEMKRKRRDRKLRIEKALDMLCVAFGVIFASLGLCFWWR